MSGEISVDLSQDSVAAEQHVDRRADLASHGHSRLGLGVLAAIVMLGRFAYSGERTIYHLIPDEPASLGVARWLSGTGSWNMFETDVWRPGTSLVVAPLYWITDDQTTVIRLSLLLGAAVAGWSAVWLARLVLRLTDVGPLAALIISGAVALMPAALSATAFVWAEPLVTLCFLAALWHLLLHVESPTPWTATAAVTWAALGLLAHNRMMPVLVVVWVVVVVRCARARRWRSGALATAVAVAMVAAGQVVMNVVIDHVWESPGQTNTVGGVLGRLRDPLAVLDAASGQIWYLLASSAMLFGVGAVELTRRAVRGPAPQTADARVVLLLSAVMLATSIIFMSNRWRSDHLVYGRYNDAIVWPILAVGAAWLVSRCRVESEVVRRWMLAGPPAVCAALTLVLIGLHGDQFDQMPAFSTMIAGVQPMMPTTYVLRPAVVTVVGLAVFGMLVVARSHTRTIMAVAVVLLLTGGVMSRRAVEWRINFSQRTEVVQELAGEVLEPGSTVGVRFTLDQELPSMAYPYQATYWYLYQWFLNDLHFETDHGLDDDVGPYVFSVDNDPVMVEVGAEVVWHDPYVPLALWREP